MKEIDYYLKHWALLSDGKPIITQTSQVYPVRYQDKPAMLKIAQVAEECRGGQLMAWWNGQGAAHIYAQHDPAVLMERAIGERSLLNMARKHQDSEATYIICSVVEKIHAVKNTNLPPKLTPLPVWFKSLETAATQHGGIFKLAYQTAQELLNTPQEIAILHGDIHHQNVLDFGHNDWRAIDPKGLIGERSFDYANIFCNPDANVATLPGRLEQQVKLVAKITNIDYCRLIQWILAYAGLSAAWHLEDGTNPELALAIANMALTIKKH